MIRTGHSTLTGSPLGVRSLPKAHGGPEENRVFFASFPAASFSDGLFPVPVFLLCPFDFPLVKAGAAGLPPNPEGTAAGDNRPGGRGGGVARDGAGPQRPRRARWGGRRAGRGLLPAQFKLLLQPLHLGFQRLVFALNFPELCAELERARLPIAISLSLPHTAFFSFRWRERDQINCFGLRPFSANQKARGLFLGIGTTRVVPSTAHYGGRAVSVCEWGCLARRKERKKGEAGFLDFFSFAQDHRVYDF